ncbi:MAG TPA: DoxX family protein [Cytophagaceae bacterium]|jgi:hypothetical protein|nr:DoxX family protein [Cytophagaceae bacterium]
MKKDKIIYWIATGLVSLAMLMSAFIYFSGNPQVSEGLKLIGFPGYMVPFLGLAKLLAAIVLVIPNFEKIKEWAYAGLAYIFIGAAWSHISTSTPFVGPLVLLVILGISYWFRGRLAATQVK